MPIRKPNAVIIHAYRVTHECSVQEAKRQCWKAWRTAVLEVVRLQCMVFEARTPESRVLLGMIETLTDYLGELEQ